MRAFAWLPVAACALGCSTPAVTSDAGPSEDAAVVDAFLAPPDAWSHDAGPLVEPLADYGSPGPHVVGSVTVTMVDRTGERTLPVEIWYPADEAARPEATTGRPIQAFESGTPHESDLDALVLAAPEACVRRTMHAAAAPAALGTEPMPVVVFSHCHACARFDMAEVAERLASHGIAVAAPDHVDNTLWDQLEGDLAPVGGEFLAVRASDVSSVLDRLLDPTAEELPADLRGRFDAEHAGVMGHSFGAATTGVVARDDDRFIAALAVAAPISVLEPVAPAELDLPFAFLLMREDNSITEVGNRIIRSDYARLGGPATLVELDDAGHWSIADICGLVPAFEAGCGDGVRGTMPGTAFTYVDPVVAREVAADTAAGFFATYLLEDPGGITVVRRLDGTNGAHVSLR